MLMGPPRPLATWIVSFLSGLRSQCVCGNSGCAWISATVSGLASVQPSGVPVQRLASLIVTYAIVSSSRS